MWIELQGGNIPAFKIKIGENMKYWFTSDEHYGHHNIIKYCNRPFSSVGEMDEILIQNHNKVVKKEDIVLHGGDFTLKRRDEAFKYINELNGKHFFVRGSHDYWMKNLEFHELWEKKINGQYVVVCHYAMRVWPRSHYGSWQLYGHSHGKLEPIEKQHDIGVDNNKFFPVSFEEIVEIMKTKDDNPNIGHRRK